MTLDATPTCFVISSLSQRSDTVLDIYLEPALRSDYFVLSPGSESVQDREYAFTHLENDALVLAYLGSPDRLPNEGSARWLWNPNVMLLVATEWDARGQLSSFGNAGKQSMNRCFLSTQQATR